MYYLTLGFILINPIVMLLVGIKFLIKCPKQTHRFAFHSPYAHHNLSMWRYTHKVAYHVWIRLGLVLSEGSLLVFVVLFSETSEDSRLIGGSLLIMMMQLFISYLSIHFIELHIKNEVRSCLN